VAWFCAYANLAELQREERGSPTGEINPYPGPFKHHISSEQAHNPFCRWVKKPGILLSSIEHFRRGGLMLSSRNPTIISTMVLISPSQEHLASYVDALTKGFSPDIVRASQASQEHLARISKNAADFLASLDDREARGGPVPLPDGSFAERLPSITRWLWDGEFAGKISLRWRPGATDLPATCLGHIGYVVVPWKQRQGYATEALRLILPEARAVGLPFVDLTTDPSNEASQRVIKKAGGVLVGSFTKAPQLGGSEGLLFRIFL
jgi:predicted acetyltransferase